MEGRRRQRAQKKQQQQQRRNMLRPMTIASVFLASIVASADAAFLQNSVPASQRRSLFSTQTLHSTNNSSDNLPEYDVEVTYEERSTNVRVQAGESILDAMERTGAARQLALPDLPFDCRRGNCLTCTGRHQEDSQQSAIERQEDGLSPYVSKQVERKGYILTCSSHVVGDGLKLVLGENDGAWHAMYKERMENESARYTGRKAMARMIRRSNEKDVPGWTKETTVALDKSEAVTTTFAGEPPEEL
mmetsp:Transcript_19592/g.54447  ORF Transcript_19592/g.54447 Transcript_19592/m.54447 type:complete len:246 (-) Transcript_19592:271-1008(-)